MPVPDLQGEINRALKELMRLKDRVLPVKVGRAVRDSVRDNFRKGGFYGQSCCELLSIIVSLNY